MNKPEPGKVYALTGRRSIAAGDTWQGSEVFCGGIRQDGRMVTHAKELAKLLGCSPDRCSLKGKS